MAPRKKAEKPNVADTPEFQLGSDAPRDPIAEFFARFPNANCKFKVGKYDGQHIVHLFTTTDIPDEDSLQETHGGGRYVIRAYEDGTERGIIEMRIAGKPGAGTFPNPESTDTEPKPNAPPVDNSETGFMKQLLLQVLKISGNGGMQSQQTPVNELAEAMKTLHALNPPGGGNAAKEYAEGLKAGIELAKNLGAGGDAPDWKTELFRMAKDVIPSVMTTLPSMMQKGQTPVNRPVNTPTVASLANPVVTPIPLPEDDELDKLLFDGIQKLKSMCMMGASPDLIIEWVQTNANQPQYQNFVRAAFTREFESFTSIDSEIAKPPYVEWFKSLYDGLRSAFKPNNEVDNDNLGTDRDARNVTNHADVGGSGE